MCDDAQQRRYYVYVLFDWDATPFYVGKGCGNRWRTHLVRIGFEVPVVKIAEELTHQEALDIEAAFIKAIGREPNGPLINQSDRGYGVATHTPETIEVIRAASKSRKYPNRKPPKPYKLSAETCKQMQQRMLGTTRSLEDRAKISAGQMGRVVSAQTRAKISQALKGRPKSLAHRANILAANQAPERRANLSAAKMGHETSPETRAKIGAKMKGRKLISTNPRVYVNAVSEADA